MKSTRETEYVVRFTAEEAEGVVNAIAALHPVGPTTAQLEEPRLQLKDLIMSRGPR